MTPEDRAWKIIAAMGMHVTASEEDRQWLATQIREAANEARSEAIARLGQWEHSAHVAHNCSGCRNKAEADAYEDAAKIAEAHGIEWEGGVAEIRARAAEGSK